jgi:hypothetical protein
MITAKGTGVITTIGTIGMVHISLIIMRLRGPITAADDLGKD